MVWTPTPTPAVLSPGLSGAGPPLQQRQPPKVTWGPAALRGPGPYSRALPPRSRRWDHPAPAASLAAAGSESSTPHGQPGKVTSGVLPWRRGGPSPKEALVSPLAAHPRLSQSLTRTFSLLSQFPGDDPGRPQRGWRCIFQLRGRQQAQGPGRGGVLGSGEGFPVASVGSWKGELGLAGEFWEMGKPSAGLPG